jgi:hypothetical protein
VISWLEAALSLAMMAVLVCIIGGWDTATKVAAVLFAVLLVLFTVRAIHRKSQGKSWDEAWGRTPR